MKEYQTNYNPQLIEAVTSNGLRLFETRRSNTESSKATMLACIIVPALNEEENISDLLNSIKNQKTDYPVVVIVSDNASTDRTSEISKSEGANVYVENKRGVGPARQRGLCVIKSIPFIDQNRVVVIQTDSDCILANENYIQSICEIYERDANMMASVGPTHYPIKTTPDTRKLLTGGNEFRAYFGSLSLKELFAKNGRDVSDYLLTEPYRVLIGTNSTFRLSAFDKYNLSYPQDKSWETIGISISLQQNITSDRIVYLNNQEVTTSSRSYVNKDGITTQNLLKKIKSQKYIKPYKSPDSIPPLKTVKAILESIDRKTYSLSNNERVVKIVSHVPKVVKRNQRVVNALHAATREVIRNKYAIVEQLQPKYDKEARIKAAKDLTLFKELGQKLKTIGITTLLDSGYAAEVACGGNITRRHDDLDLILVGENTNQKIEYILEMVLETLKSFTGSTWESKLTKKGWLWLQRDMESPLESVQLNIHILNGYVGTDSANILDSEENNYSLGVKSSVVKFGNDNMKLLHPNINEIVASKIRLIEPYGNNPRFKDVFDLRRMIKNNSFSKEECLKILKNFYKSRFNLSESESWQVSNKIYNNVVARLSNHFEKL